MAGRVLVVEDDDAVRTAVDRGLGVHGFDVSSVPDAESALAAVARRRPDLMIVDVGLPGMSGIELCTRLRGLDVDTPILILSARDQVGDRVAGLQAGADDYLVKPFSLDELAARLHALLRRSRPSAGCDVGARRGTAVDRSRPSRCHGRRRSTRTVEARVRPAGRRSPRTPASCCRGFACWSWCGVTTSTSTPTWSMCSSATCDASSSPPVRHA